MREAEGYREVLLAIREAYGMEIQALTVPQVATCLNCDGRTVKMLIVKLASVVGADFIFVVIKCS